MGDRSKPRTIRIVLALLIATFVAYLPALSAGFIWDDNDWLTENPAVTGEDGWASIWTGEARLQYYPMLFSVFWVEFRFWGLDPVGYHALNVLLHACNADPVRGDFAFNPIEIASRAPGVSGARRARRVHCGSRCRDPPGARGSTAPPAARCDRGGRRR